MRGRKLLDEMSGFREYLEIAEKDEMNLRNPPERTPLLFETYLPFALAMGVEQVWAERFAKVFLGAFKIAFLDAGLGFFIIILRAVGGNPG